MGSLYKSAIIILFLTTILLSIEVNGDNLQPNTKNSSFGNEENFNFLLDLQEKSIDLVEQKGIGVSLDLFSGFSKNLASEVHVFGDRAAIFCSSGGGVATDIGGSISGAAIKTFGCPSADSYKGWFLNFGLSTNANLAGVPGGITIMASFGVDLEKLVSELKTFRRAQQSSFPEAAKKVLDTDDTPISHNIKFLVFLRYTNAQFFNDNGLEKKLDQLITQSIAQNSNQIKEYIADPSNTQNNDLDNWLDDESSTYLSDKEKNSLKQFNSIYNQNFTGCNSVSAAAGASLSLAPFAISISATNYVEAMSIDKKDLFHLDRLTPVYITFLLTQELIYRIQNLGGNCNREAYEKFNQAARNDLKLAYAISNVPKKCWKNYLETEKKLQEIMNRTSNSYQRNEKYEAH